MAVGATLGRGSSPSSTPIWPVWPLSKDFAQHWVVFVFVNVVNSNMSLQVIGSRVFVFPIWTKRADVARRIMDQSVPNHLVLPLESLASLTARTSLDRAVVWTGRRMHIGVRVKKILGLEGGCRAS